MVDTTHRRPKIIAHRGASGYLPEHTLVAKAMAFGMGADYIEQDVVATRDGELLGFHDLTLDDMTNVAELYPGRARPDGLNYCIDFTLSEIRQLHVRERRIRGSSTPRYTGRFPDGAGSFSIPTLGEELRFIQGLIRSTGRRVGIYPEIKEPAWHRQHGFDLGGEVVRTLGQFGYDSPEDDVFVQCFDAAELERLRGGANCHLKFVHLLESASSVPTPRQLIDTRMFADAIGPSLRLIYRGMSAQQPVLTTLVGDAHDAGLEVHPYTLRKDDLPPGIDDFHGALDLFLLQIGVDGVFTDFPDLAAQFVAAQFPA